MNPDAALKALAEPHRRDILRLVSATPRSVGEIADHLDITSQAVSRHLKVLREAGLVDERREGTRHLFLVRPDGFSAVQDFLDDFWTRHLGQLKAALESPRRQQPPTPPTELSESRRHHDG
ncbi:MULTISPECIES: helix-turn-helix transcriptional regulator [unclassified Pseudofrankia]|uniref:ArsR/SmtB family transcription factor n=1 Tax=unclassified Pseudofrankia TaxID=2994372 RepID=UPI0008DA4DC2|nr:MULTISPECIES: metalloregulator ArsR/SmtB family transcription factor [unclassified Pseudofrankia]MDT3440726.1 metalloregulator ArsR/SmtB family transcription factor [Pseudofrankia sp. BMG5.37]OHV58926.1 transcriptional regulator [Pseudofrankia sp. BMG5.36]